MNNGQFKQRAVKTKIFCDTHGFMKFGDVLLQYIQLLIKLAIYRLCNCNMSKF